jgi:hypothetical protein
MAEVYQKRNNLNKYYRIFYTIRTAIAIILLFFSVRIQAAEQKYDLIYPKKLIKLARSLGMEPIGGEKFLHNLKIYSGQGLPYAFNVLRKVEKPENITIPASVIFWCKKGKKRYLVYAVDNQKDGKHYNYEVKSVISTRDLFGHDYDIEFSYGMIVYDGVLGITKDLSHFTYLDNPKEHGPNDVYPILSNGFLPIIMYQDSSLTVLYRYKGRWLQYSEVDI